jgi:Asp-tRNA(Asn)/Glu-tRNA(Gln) amidotransferase A subunit family amidase
VVADNVDVEGFHTVCGGLEFVGNPPAAKDSKHVALLRQLGAIPIGKTNVPYVSILQKSP